MIKSSLGLGTREVIVKIASLTVAVATLFFTVGCTVTGVVHEALERPLINPAARDVLRITVISKTDANIRLQAGYATRNPACEVEKWLGNPKLGHTTHDVFDVPTRKDGAVVEILIDKYLPGRCLWGFGGISVGAIVPGESDQAWSGFLSLSSDGSVPNRPLSITCREFGSDRRFDCHTSIHHIRHDIRDITFETQPYEERPRK